MNRPHFTAFLFSEPAALPEHLRQQGHHLSDHLTWALGVHTRNPRLLDRWARSSNVVLLCAILANPATTKRHIKAVARYDHPVTRTFAVQHPHCPKSTLRTLARYGSLEVRCAIARRPKLPRSVAIDLAQDAARTVRRALSANPAAPDDARTLAALTLLDS